jgi:ribosomal protein S18 acetylase RimI-like enzyme
MELVWWDEADGTRLYLLDAGAELGVQEARAREHAAADPAVGTAMFGVNADDPETQAMVVEAGYAVAFTRVRMTKDLRGPATVEMPAGIEIRPATPADHRLVYDDIATVFAGSRLGYVQDSFEEFEQDAAEDFPDHSLWTLGWAGETLAGWVISGVGDTPWVGVRAEWRRRGLASALMRANHRQLWDHGVRVASLWTVAENPTGSVALYERLGYRVVERQPRYRKAFQPA